MGLVHCKVIPYRENIVKAPGFDRSKSGPYFNINPILIVEPRELSRSLTGTDLTYSLLGRRLERDLGEVFSTGSSLV